MYKTSGATVKSSSAIDPSLAIAMPQLAASSPEGVTTQEANNQDIPSVERPELAGVEAFRLQDRQPLETVPISVLSVCESAIEVEPGLALERAEAAPKGMPILLVEDDASTAHAVAQLLGALGHDVVTVADGVEAWSLLQDHHMPVVLADWMMPSMDGLELCRRIRAQTGRSYTYVVLFTARHGYEDRLEALAVGVDDFLAKPLDTRELVARLEVARRLLNIQEELEQKNLRLLTLATTDDLTGLRNRRRLTEDLESHFSLATRQRTPLSLVFIDVDHFKSYNDSFGHPAGDDVLRGIGEVLRGGTRSHDTAARHGGEEFAVLLPGTGPVVARGMAERLRKTIQQRDWPYRRVTASFGVATMSLKMGNAQELMDQADHALYYSKLSGRNRVTHHSDLGAHPANRGVREIVDGAVSSPLEIDTPTTDPRAIPTEADNSGLAAIQDGLVEGWLRAMDLRSHGVCEHSRRVTATMLKLAHTLGIDQAELADIRRGALLHDIGKLGIPEAILNKTGPLSGEEWDVMRRHPEYALELLAPVDSLSPAVDIPYCHHERWDGSGYPRGLKGEQIPLAARAFAAVDIWDALGHDRPYRKAWPEERVRSHVAALAGTHLDPDVVTALFRTLSSTETGSG
jgi:diguanylate cyclase (GGDEF)-like protein/putative nucleotidyltransferase with HDIG domain